ncbi:hypothetical protein ACPV4A_01110 [Vibrio rotiferianus]|uniref:hypothetical protein n=1 Tax=Vibrio rotiferianus TaxID=190895 RepID=UPI00406A499B
MYFYGDADLPNATIVTVGFFTVASILAAILYFLGFFKDIKGLNSDAKRMGRKISILVGCFILMSAIVKLVGFEPMKDKYVEMGITHLYNFIIVSEFFSGILILIPSTFRIAFLIGTTMLGGAIMSHLPVYSDGFIWSMPSASVITLLWIAAFLYDTDVFPSWLTESKFINKMLGRYHVN